MAVGLCDTVPEGLITVAVGVRGEKEKRERGLSHVSAGKSGETSLSMCLHHATRQTSTLGQQGATSTIDL